ncbi:MAG: non-canonical purine NTP pyrophosphatase [Candidatus Micrarchaeota archaeon]
MDGKPRLGVYFASSNPEKIAEARLILSRYGIRVRTARIELHEPSVNDQRKVAQAKAAAAFKALGCPALAEDTAVYFNATPGYPGLGTAREFRRLGFKGLLARIRGKARGARFVTMVAYCDSKKSVPKVFIGVLRGRLAARPKRTGRRGMRFPYERIFRPCNSGKLLCEMTAAEKMRISHRSKAFAKFAAWFKSRR